MDAENLIYSKRYPSAQREMESIAAAEPLCGDKENIDKSFQEFMKRMERIVYKPIPEKQEQAREFISLAKELSEAYEIDIDIKRKVSFIEVNLHLYCSYYPDELTKILARLLVMSDRFCSFILKTEPSDFTLSLDFFTHEAC